MWNNYFVGTRYNKAWATSCGVTGNDVAYIRKGIARGSHLGLRTNRVLGLQFTFILPAMSVTKDEIFDLIKANNDKLMSSFKDS